MSAVHSQTELTPAQLLAGSPHESVRGLVVTETATEVVISGVVPNYYLKQIAQETVRPTLGQRRLRNMVSVGSGGGPSHTLPPAPPERPERHDRKPVPTQSPSVDQLAAELGELRRQSPPADLAGQRADCQWLHDHWNTPTLEPYRGTTVAILNGAVVGHADNPLQLELDVARRYGVHPDRLVVEYIPRRGEFHLI